MSIKRTITSGFDGSDWSPILGWFLIAGLVLVTVLGTMSNTFSSGKFIASGLSSLFLGASALFVGTILGFIFAIPRSHQGNNSQVIGSNLNSSDNNAVETQIRYMENTNLEQISDWLTKIIVGVTLIEFQTLGESLSDISTDFGPLFHDQYGAAVAGAVIVFFVTGGFLTTYLWTRIYLAKEFVKGAMTEEFTRRSEIQDKIDASALSIADRQLSRTNDSTPFATKELKELLGKASASVREVIFQKARRQRRNSWKDDKERMENTIPVFRGLIGANTADSKSYAQLGYALKDMVSPDWEGALDSLNKAITNREVSGKAKRYFQEANRAICLINLDQNYKAGVASTKKSKAKIIRDLKVSSQVVIDSSDTIAKWIEINEVEL